MTRQTQQPFHAGAAPPPPRAAHVTAVERLRADLQALDPAIPRRLAKQTSNLFRFPAARGRGGPGLSVEGLDGVLAVDPVGQTAEVQGMCTYETLVEVTLRYGLMPLVVPQLRTITIGGAVTGLGIEATSFTNGLPHESVLSLDVLTGAGEVVTATPGGEHADLFAAFPNSYGSLGYATAVTIELQPVRTRVRTTILHFTGLEPAIATIEEVMHGGRCQPDGAPVDFLDGVVFAADDAVLVLGSFTDDPAPTSDYTGRQVYYRSLRTRTADLLATSDYLWRWDTDWFWCSAAFGVQHPLMRRLWPRRYRRSDVYHALVNLEARYGVAARWERLRGRPDRERLVQDVELPLERTAEFLDWYLREVAMTPVWLCPLRLREPAGPGSARRWPLYPLEPGRAYVNAGFWGTVPIAPDRRDGDVNRAVEAHVARLDGHKSLYSDVYYDRDTFEAAYGGAAYRLVKERYDPGHRLPQLYDKVTRR